MTGGFPIQVGLLMTGIEDEKSGATTAFGTHGGPGAGWDRALNGFDVAGELASGTAACTWLAGAARRWVPVPEAGLRPVRAPGVR